MKKLLVITWPDFFPGEAQILTRLFQAGLTRLHLRKPAASRAELRALLASLPTIYYPRIALHDHFALATEPAFAGHLGGLHLNRRNPAIPGGYTGCVSCSCHSLEEVAGKKAFDYVFLSPVFPSLSKPGYGEGFPPALLHEATRTGLIDERVIALGGISTATIPQLAQTGFGGVAVLGALWGKTPGAATAEATMQRYQQLQQHIYEYTK